MCVTLSGVKNMNLIITPRNGWLKSSRPDQKFKKKLQSFVGFQHMLYTNNFASYPRSLGKYQVLFIDLIRSS